jgi:hypothetical protein
VVVAVRPVESAAKRLRAGHVARPSTFTSSLAGGERSEPADARPRLRLYAIAFWLTTPRSERCLLFFLPIGLRRVGSSNSRRVGFQSRLRARVAADAPPLNRPLRAYCRACMASKSGQMTASTATYPGAVTTSVERREFYCAKCGYGVVVRREPPECPMCRARDWREPPTLMRRNVLTVGGHGGL